MRRPMNPLSLVVLVDMMTSKHHLRRYDWTLKPSPLQGVFGRDTYNLQCNAYPIGSMYGILIIFTYIWLIFRVNVGK